MRKIRRVGRSELENVRLKARKKEKEGERGRKRAECRRYRGKKGKTEKIGRKLGR